MTHNYFYGNEAEQYQFITIPKTLMTDAKFSTLSLSAKVLYGLLLDRMKLSRKNKWMDEQNRVYIIFPIEEISATLGLCKRTAISYLKELEEHDLVEKRRRGLGLPSLLYVKRFFESEPVENHTKAASYESAEKYTSQMKESPLTEVQNQAPNNNTDINNTDYSNTIYPSDEMDTVENVREQIRENIEYDELVVQVGENAPLVDEIVELIVDTMLSKCSEIRIGQAMFSHRVVCSRLWKLNNQHMQYVIESLDSNRSKIKNIRAYLLTALYNAPVTMESYWLNQYRSTEGGVCHE